MQVKYFTKKLLIAANKEAIYTDRNRCLEPEALETLDDDFKFPVAFSMVHNDVEMRVMITLGKRGPDSGQPEIIGPVFLDIPFETFDSLPSVEVSE